MVGLTPGAVYGTIYSHKNDMEEKRWSGLKRLDWLQSRR
jgi:hypothetical protein